MKNNRFYWSKSNVYGICVYDRERGNIPAYDACAEFLPPEKIDSNGTITTISPILLENEFQAMRICTRLNTAYKRATK